MEELLSWINNQLTAAGIPYEFMEWTGEVTYPYTVGEYSEFESMDEDREEDKTFILTAFYRGSGSRMKLEQLRSNIERLFPRDGSKTAVLESGSGIAVYYVNAHYIPTGEADLSRMEINLGIKLWKVG